MASFNVLFFACDRSVCVRKDGEFLLLDNPGEVLCKWLVENIDESGRPITEERDFKAVVLFQSSGVSEILFSPKELASAKGITKARAGEAALDEEKVEALFVEVRVDLQKVADKVSDAEANITALQTEVHQLKQQMTRMTTPTTALEERAEDEEGRSRRNDIRLLGFPEGTEGQSTELLLYPWVPEELKLEGSPQYLLIEQAHQALTPKPPPGAALWALIAQLLNYRDKDAILRVAREHPPLQYEGQNIIIYPDYTR
ncbi:hypothetical protein NDU88_006150 [Pleurodeles waltl]|uniref:Uncharacterized protein n=1 Tax=Pleurodeles waltl TaxID=8319 RepID=A0AAV7WWR6_PLEWA|nr:hypothetical protein NDU88_006150 [Pleurodeles waltl]